MHFRAYLAGGESPAVGLAAVALLALHVGLAGAEAGVAVALSSATLVTAAC